MCPIHPCSSLRHLTANHAPSARRFKLGSLADLSQAVDQRYRQDVWAGPDQGAAGRWARSTSPSAAAALRLIQSAASKGSGRSWHRPGGEVDAPMPKRGPAVIAGAAASGTATVRHREPIDLTLAAPSATRTRRFLVDGYTGLGCVIQGAKSLFVQVVPGEVTNARHLQTFHWSQPANATRSASWRGLSLATARSPLSLSRKE